jgi:signal transduction histidine kinase
VHARNAQPPAPAGSTPSVTQQAFDHLYSRVTQRLDQTEALLDGLVALLRAVPDPDFQHLQRYSNEILRRYSHIHTVGYQVRVEHAQRAEFEYRMNTLLGRECPIRDYAIEGDRTWRVAPPRPFYYPAAFMAPDVAGAQDVIGYDGYGDTLFRAAIERAGGDERGVATLPFDLIEGGRGYVFLRAFNTEGQAARATGPAAHIVSLLVRADRLVDDAAVAEGKRSPDSSNPPAALPALDSLGLSIAHELNQPLTAVVGYSQAALRMLEPSARAAPVREALQAGIEQALRASDLIRRLRGLVQQRTPRFEVVSLREVIEDAVQREQGALTGVAITFALHCPQTALDVQGDAVLLAQLFGNLLRNAVQAIETVASSPARIDIDVGARGAHWCIDVADSGPGLSAAQRRRAFHPVTSTKAQGLGVGLAVCATIAEAHGGSIAVKDGDAATPGCTETLRGARFVVMLPRAVADGIEGIPLRQ